MIYNSILKEKETGTEKKQYLLLHMKKHKTVLKLTQMFLKIRGCLFKLLCMQKRYLWIKFNNISYPILNQIYYTIVELKIKENMPNYIKQLKKNQHFLGIAITKQPYTAYYPVIGKSRKSKWWRKWEINISKLHYIKPYTEKCP